MFCHLWNFIFKIFPPLLCWLPSPFRSDVSISCVELVWNYVKIQKESKNPHFTALDRWKNVGKRAPTEGFLNMSGSLGLWGDVTILWTYKLEWKKMIFQNNMEFKHVACITSFIAVRLCYEPRGHAFNNISVSNALFLLLTNIVIASKFSDVLVRYDSCLLVNNTKHKVVLHCHLKSLAGLGTCRNTWFCGNSWNNSNCSSLWVLSAHSIRRCTVVC